MIIHFRDELDFMFKFKMDKKTFREIGKLIFFFNILNYNSTIIYLFISNSLKKLRKTNLT